MPLDDGCRFDQHHGVEDLRPDPVKPNPEQPVGKEEPRAAGALPTQDSHLVSQSNKLELQRSAAAYPEREQGTDSGQKGDHAHDGMGTAQETLHLVGGFDFCAGTVFRWVRLSNPGSSTPLFFGAPGLLRPRFVL